jgi:hypothetical protein
MVALHEFKCGLIFVQQNSKGAKKGREQASVAKDSNREDSIGKLPWLGLSDGHQVLIRYPVSPVMCSTLDWWTEVNGACRCRCRKHGYLLKGTRVCWNMACRNCT